ncbi:M48 family metalloprotease [Thermoleptolyngbya sp. M55_K2018_002]|uniref:M48 family metalloprotease n=1 Tax=Thermoleptolyngbya sp. M55_K2018_002 TaxID=2747808 RepID=UPI0025F4B2B9|nr:M48 family metalloprotease [Thermoleptolyngbya sp. M55_K2018_002]
MTAENLLKSGIQAVKQQQYKAAIQALMACCQAADRQSKLYFQAQMWLVRAYYDGGQTERAIALCQQMSTDAPPQVQTWAKNLLPTLSAAPAIGPDTAGSAATDAPTADLPQLSAEEALDLFNRGNHALKTKRFAEAVEHLETYCRSANPHHKDFAQAQMWLVKAYNGNGQTETAIALCRQLLHHEKEFVQLWARQYLNALAPEPEAEATQLEAPLADAAGLHPKIQNRKSNISNAQPSALSPTKTRAPRGGVSLVMKGVASSLALASGMTITLLFGMVFALCMALLFLHGSDNPTAGLGLALVATLLFNAIVFFLSPLIMDVVQGWLYGTRWVSLSDIERRSPEAGRVIRTVCQQKKLAQPRLGLIPDDNPTAFTYGSLPNTARVVVSQGLFKYLDDDEVATVYAHELGHVVHWDFAVMTLAATLVQITYLLYVYLREAQDWLGDSEMARRLKLGMRSVAIAAYVFYVLGEYLVLYLSRTREYYADHFAAEVTGNPNGLSRALVKIAYGIVEEGQHNPQPSKVLQGTRTLGIADSSSAGFTGTAYRVAASPVQVGRVFLWDMFNPWAAWMELNSTHPLTGKRVRALSTYAEQLGLGAEFDMAQVVREGRGLNKTRLYGNFVLDVLLYWADWIGFGLGLLVAIALYASNLGAIAAPALLGGGIGLLFKTFVMYPDFNRAPAMDILTLMSDPYASPLRGRPVKLSGEIIGKGDSGYAYGSELKLQDPTGMILLRYSSRFGPLGNFLFGASQAESFIHQSVSALGWFRRGMMPWVDLIRLDCPAKWTVRSYHRFWNLLFGALLIGLAFVLPSVLA